jgi:hypothetical protein
MKMKLNNLFAINWVDCDKKETEYKTWSSTIYTVEAVARVAEAVYIETLIEL